MFKKNYLYRTILILTYLSIASCGSSSNFIDSGSTHLPPGNYYADISDVASNISSKYPLCASLFNYPPIVNINNSGQICINGECGITITLSDYDYDQCAEQTSQTDMGELNETIDYCDYEDRVFSGVIQKEYPSQKLVCSAILIMYPTN